MILNIDVEHLGADAYTGDSIERHTNTATGHSYLVRLSVLDELPENFSPLLKVVDED